MIQDDGDITWMERYKKFSIELDCAPGRPRPWDLIGIVLEDTGLKEEDFSTAKPFFGHQVWVLKESANKDALFDEKRPILKKRVEELYNNGLIRYGSW